ncbi:hypothetical protein SADUNF_SadunfUnG0007800 [Salix dunnii]|uniref:GHMP kinase C-terminal domain-containing protein n=1 Tax=Salix dunnii TaxID=1413687 RepID=A0A835J0A3_9ROSI|nr:hypothetical protein SADUNF_SadunfUnG0007800 [Salix dunnii]
MSPSNTPLPIMPPIIYDSSNSALPIPAPSPNETPVTSSPTEPLPSPISSSTSTPLSPLTPPVLRRSDRPRKPYVLLRDFHCSQVVPEGKGVSSSASVEVASMSTIAAAHGKTTPVQVTAPPAQADSGTHSPSSPVNSPTHSPSHDISPIQSQSPNSPSSIPVSSPAQPPPAPRTHTMCTRSMNHIYKPKHMYSATLHPLPLPLEPTSPAEVIGLVEIPSHIRFWGIDSGIRHRYEALYAKMLPESILGETFLEKYIDHSDAVTVIDEKRTYVVRAPAKHPIYENFRVKAFKALLTSTSSDEQLTALGELLYQCHYSYGACGLGSDGTDRLVRLVQEMQHGKPSSSEDGTLYGAKITGGGSSGIVCVIGRNCLRSSQQILEIQHRYKGGTGYLPFIFEGSSPGSGKFGYLRIRRPLSRT